MQPNTSNAEERRQVQASWPIIEGSYRIGDPAAPVAVCALTSDELLAPLAVIPGVAIAGEVQTANLGRKEPSCCATKWKPKGSPSSPKLPPFSRSGRLQIVCSGAFSGFKM